MKRVLHSLMVLLLLTSASAYGQTISGHTTPCLGGSTYPFTIDTSGGTWSSSNVAAATIGSATGILSPVAAGATTISYNLPAATYTVAVTVSASSVQPNTVAGAGPPRVCIGSTQDFNNLTGGGTWSSSNVALGSVVSGTGLVTGIAQGTIMLTYHAPSGCKSLTIVSVNVVPVLTGPTEVCVGTVATYTGTPTGGTWVSQTPAFGTIDASGNFTAIAQGTTVLSYTLSTGCRAQQSTLVQQIPNAISGTNVICQGNTTTLTSSSTNQTWSSSNPAVATVASVTATTGLVTGVSGGVVNISYTNAAGCSRVYAVTVNALPDPISGSLFVCNGFTTALSSSPAGGTWASSNGAVASVGTTGIVSGLSVGTSNISYTLGTGCRRVAQVTVGINPTAITGSLFVCHGTSHTLSSTPASQTWSSSNTSVATINASSGLVAGVAIGTSNISYTHSNGCYATSVVTVSTEPSTGDNIVCEGETITLSNTTPGGTWSASNGNATVGIGTGIVTGVTAGAVNITYSVIAHGCIAVTAMTVNPAMTPITGQHNLCIGTSSTLSHAIGGGTWVSSNAAIATVVLGTGVVTGVSGGVANITYTVSSGCTMVTQVTVHATLPDIIGTDFVCLGNPDTALLSHPITPGTWSSSNPAIALIGSSTGIITAVAGGTSTITYHFSPGCFRTKLLAVHALPIAIVGSSAVCEGVTTALTNPMGTGTWASADPAIATIGSTSGFLTGVSEGTVIITYTMYTGCFTTRIQTVNLSPDPIVGSAAGCVGATNTFTNATPGGTWSSNATGIATIGSSSGIATGVLQGLAMISYTMPTGCYSNVQLTVNIEPAVIEGTNTVCVGNSILLSTITPGGVWSTDDAGVATVTPGGVVTGISGGTTAISYSLGSGCSRSVVITVNAAIATNTGNALICLGGTTTLANASGGGTWLSSNPAVATVNSATGLVTALTVGTTNVHYVVSTGCYNTTQVTVNGALAAIGGSPNTCIGTTSTLTHAVGGGTWASSNLSVATIDVNTGELTGVAVGTSTITYLAAPGCLATLTVVVNLNPAAITGNPNICEASVNILSDVSGGGTWSSSDTDVAPVYYSSGAVTGSSVGTAIITYMLYTGCFATTEVTVNPLPDPISGFDSICVGSTATFTNTTGGGVWNSSTSSVASIDSFSGLATGLLGGSTNISYTIATGCRRIMAVTVNNLPAPITGMLTICPGGTSMLTSITSGATWSSATPSVATISVSGVVMPITTGNTVISYTNIHACARTAEVTVTALPPAITGSASVCIGSTSALANATSGGTWSSSNAGVAAVNATTGMVSGVTGGTATITYALAGAGCYSTLEVTVSSTPAAITGTTSVCIGGVTTLSHVSGGGTWSSSNPAIGTVDASSGEVTGISVGAVSITYTVTPGCFTSIVVNVQATPVITTTGVVCVGATTTPGHYPTGGTWESSAPSNATVGSTSGIITGVLEGTTIISYTASPGCMSTTEITVNAVPAITSNNAICLGNSETFTTSTPGGTWTSSNATVATVGSGTGLVTGIAAGTATITYTIGTGCRATTIVTIGTMPAAITGNLTVCAGSTTALGSTPSGGTWSSANTAAGTVDLNTGVVTGIDAGVTTISYTKNGCVRTEVVTVNAALTAITGDLIVCAGNSSTLSNATGGGTWSVSTPSIAIINITTGTVTGINAGTATVTYRTGSSCFTTAVVTVNGALASITGTASACIGTTATLSIAASGGTWSSSNTSVATVDGTTGVVTGVATGTTTVSYVLSTGCYQTITFVVQSLPAAIGGTPVVCAGSTTLLTNSTGGGTWSSSSSNATMNTSSGLVTGVSAGTSTITYMLHTGCYATTEVSVNALPDPITGFDSICVGSTVSFTNTTGGGVWNSSTPSVVSIDSFSGSVTALLGGSSNISYTLSTGCRRIMAVTVNNIPAPITGNLTVCPDGTTMLSTTTTGGTWSSATPSVATISVSGVVLPVNTGVTVISYTNSHACARTAEVTVTAAPPAITGSSTICIGSFTTLANATSGGTWSSSNTAKATINATTGVVNGVSSGTATITYTVAGGGCYTTMEVTVSSTPAAITGTTNVCVGSVTTLSHPSSGGTWSSSNLAIGTVDASTGAVTGISVGAVSITYTVSDGCFRTVVVNVNAQPVLTTTGSVCQGSTMAIGYYPTGGTWASSVTVTATVSASGVVTGVAAGTSVISYTKSPGCMTTTEVTINPIPDVITGNTAVCVGSTETLSSAPGGGTWSSSNLTKATIGSTSGMVTGVAAGTATISYVASGCRRTVVVTVGSMPSAIAGTLTVCAGSTTTLTSSPTGGTWLSTNSAAGTVGSTVGVVTGIASGVTTISYTKSGCVRTAVVTVNAALTAITGDLLVCAGNTTALANATSGGTWSSSTPAKATIHISSGIATGVSAGSSNITYRTGTTCFTTAQLTVNSTLATITGTTNVCIGATTTLSIAATGGTWSSSNLSRATVDETTGVVTGVSAGAVTISYTQSTGCYKTISVAVQALPAAIGGTASVCVGSTTLLTNSTGGGTWSSSAAHATMTATSGLVTGVSAGNSTITYRLYTGCYITREVTVNPLPDAITGTTTICAGYMQTLASATGGGTWSSSNLTKATVGSTSGEVTGVAAGTATISYILPTGCRRTTAVTVATTPAAITGTFVICNGSTSMLNSSTSGGTWSSSNGSIASVGTGSGLVTGAGTGNATISYTHGTTGCAATAAVTVNAALTSNTGNPIVCAGQTSLLANETSGGTWSSSAPTKASVNVTTGLVTGVSAGTTNITYRTSGGCYAVTQVTANSAPVAITGTTNVCVGATTTLSHAVSGGTWVSANDSRATVGVSSGMVTGVSAGTVFMTYILPSGCYKTILVTVLTSPATISGSATVCIGGTTALTNGVSGGTWSSSNTSVGTVGATSGIVAGLTDGTTTITYRITSTACYTTLLVTVSSTPDAGFITGESALLVGGTTTLSSDAPGGSWSSSDEAVAVVNASTGEVTALTVGSVDITYTVATSCGTDFTSHHITTYVEEKPGASGTSVASTSNAFSVFPNPTTGVLTVTSGVAGTVIIYTVEGREVKQYKVTAEATVLSLPSNLSSGVYMCHFRGDDGSTRIVRLVFNQ